MGPVAIQGATRGPEEGGNFPFRGSLYGPRRRGRKGRFCGREKYSGVAKDIKVVARIKSG